MVLRYNTDEDQVINLMLNDDVYPYIQRLAKGKKMTEEEVVALFLRDIASLSLEELQCILEKELCNLQENLNEIKGNSESFYFVQTKVVSDC